MYVRINHQRPNSYRSWKWHLVLITRKFVRIDPKNSISYRSSTASSINHQVQIFVSIDMNRSELPLSIDTRLLALSIRSPIIFESIQNPFLHRSVRMLPPCPSTHLLPQADSMPLPIRQPHSNQLRQPQSPKLVMIWNKLVSTSSLIVPN